MEKTSSTSNDLSIQPDCHCGEEPVKNLKSTKLEKSSQMTTQATVPASKCIVCDSAEICQICCASTCACMYAILVLAGLGAGIITG